MRVKKLQLLLTLLFAVAINFSANAQVGDPCNQFGLVQDIDTGDTGELRYSFSSAPCGTFCASYNLSALATQDGFINLSGGSTSRSNAIIDLRVKDGTGGYEFTQSGATQNGTATFPPYVAGDWAEICIDWNAPGVGIAPDVTVTINGINVAGTFASEGADVAAIEGGAQTIQFRFAGGSAVEPAGVGLYVDNITVVDCAGATIFADDFLAYADGDPLIEGAGGYHPNSSDALVATEDLANCTVVPTVGQWGLILLALSLSSIGLIAVREEEAVFA